MLNFAKSIDEYRAHIPVLQTKAYFETASTGLIPDYVYDGVNRYIEARYVQGGDVFWQYDDGEVWLLDMINRSKAAIAKMVNSDESEIAFGQSATQMFTLVTEGIDYAKDANIVSTAGGWIGHRYAWQKRNQEGLEVRLVQPDNGYVSADRIIAACDENTAAVSVNIVESFNGYRLDIDKLGEYCDSHGILFFCDGVQALGVLDIDVKKSHIDFLVGNDYKWMQNYCGTGFVYISPKVQSMIMHWGAGWMSDTDRFCTTKDELKLRNDAGRFEIGYPNVPGIYGLGLVAEQYNRLGRQNVEEYVLSLRDYCFKKIANSSYVKLAYIFEHEDEYCQSVIVEISEECKVTDEDFANAGVVVSIRDNRQIRLAFHYYNSEEDIDRFFDVING